MISQAAIKILGLVYKLYLTNRPGFGDEGNAIYSAGFQIYALLLTLSSIGVPNAVSKLVAEKISIGDTKGAYRVFRISMCVFSFAGLLATLLLFLGADFISNYLLNMPEAKLTLMTLSPSIFFVSINSVFRGFFNGTHNMKATGKSQTIEQLAKTIATVILVETIVIYMGKADTTIMAAIANLATTIATIFCFIYLARYLSKKKKDMSILTIGKSIYKEERVKDIVKKIIGTAVPMSLSSIFSSINKNVDSMTVIRGLEHNIGYEQAKIQYGILGGKVDTIVNLPLSFNMAFATALVPSISSSKAVGRIEDGKEKIKFSMLLTILIALPCMLGLIVFAEPILKLFFPNAASGAFILQVASISILFNAMEQTTSGALQGLGKERIPTIAIFIGVIVKTILNFILIPIPTTVLKIGGVAGAAIATTACHFIACIIEMIALKKHIDIKFPIWKYYLKPLLASIIMIILAKLVYSNMINFINSKVSLIISIVFAAIIYIIMIIILKIFNKNELKILKNKQKS